MDKSFQFESFTSEFKNQFKDVELNLKSVILESGVIHVFFAELKSEEILSLQWKKLSNFIALNFQNNIESDFERWNIYLFYLVTEEVKNDLKYKIENDTFSSRKIVSLPADFDSIIDRHILNSDLCKNIDQQVLGSTEFQADSALWDILKGKVLKKKKRTDQAGYSFDLFVSVIKKQKNEI